MLFDRFYSSCELSSSVLDCFRVWPIIVIIFLKSPLDIYGKNLFIQIVKLIINCASLIIKIYCKFPEKLFSDAKFNLKNWENTNVVKEIEKNKNLVLADLIQVEVVNA